MKFLPIIYVFLEIVVPMVNSARILAMITMPIYSHQIFHRPLWANLLKNGHQITLITANPINGKIVGNLTQINMHSTYQIIHRSGIQEDLIRNGGNSLKMMQKFLTITEDLAKEYMENDEIRNLLNDSTQNFDLVIAEAVFPFMYVFSDFYNCPLVSVISSNVPFYVHDTMGNPTHPILHPDCILPFVEDLDFPERILAVFYQITVKILRRFVYVPLLNNLINKYFPNTTKTIEELEDQVSLLILNINPLLQDKRPLSTNTISIGGGGFHIDPPQPLPQELQTFLDNADEQGVILFSLGSWLDSHAMAADIQAAILSTFAELPYRVLWKHSQLDHVPDNVKVVQWLPQQDVLRHRNVKLFITHGGLLSVEEAIYGGVPMVALPLGGNTLAMAKVLQKRGLGVFLQLHELTKFSFRRAIVEVLNSKKYGNAVRRMGALLRDQPMTALEKTTWWIEYVIRHQGAQHFKTPSIPLYQYFLLDVWGFVLLLFLLFIVVVRRIILLFVIKEKID